jgi:uncharacterized protein
MRPAIFSWQKYIQHIQRLIAVMAMILLCSGLVALPANATGVYQMPPTAPDRTRVVDDGEILSRLTEGQITKKFNEVAEATGYQTWLVTIHRLDYGLSIEDFTNQLFEKWFPTPEAQANQTLIAIDSVTNNAGLRSGETVKSVLTDEIAASVVNETIQVPLIQGDKYNQALQDASDRVAIVLSGEPDPGPPVFDNSVDVERTYKTAEETDTNNATIVVVVLLVLATVIPMVTYYWYVS